MQMSTIESWTHFQMSIDSFANVYWFICKWVLTHLQMRIHLQMSLDSFANKASLIWKQAGAKRSYTYGVPKRSIIKWNWTINRRLFTPTFLLVIFLSCGCWDNQLAHFFSTPFEFSHTILAFFHFPCDIGSYIPNLLSCRHAIAYSFAVTSYHSLPTHWWFTSGCLSFSYCWKTHPTPKYFLKTIKHTIIWRFWHSS